MAVPTTYETALVEVAALSTAAVAEKTAVTAAYAGFDTEAAALATAITALSGRLSTLDSRVTYVKATFGVAL